MKKKQKVPYRICVHTTGYTGNFERELIGYTLGVLDEVQEDNLSWDDQNDYCKHWFYQDIMKMQERLYYFKLSEKHQEQTGLGDLLTSRENLLLQEFLLETYQEVDDWEQMTFYYIDKYFKDKEYDCNSVYIQLNKPLNDIWEEIIITRMFRFFKDNRIINEKYGSLGIIYGNGKWDDIKLLSLELIDENDNVIKEYHPEDYEFNYPLKNYFELTTKFND